MGAPQFIIKWQKKKLLPYTWLGVFDKGLYNNGMETLPGPTIKAGACHSPINNCKHKRTADNCVNPRSIQRSPEMLIAIA